MPSESSETDQGKFCSKSNLLFDLLHIQFCFDLKMVVNEYNIDKLRSFVMVLFSNTNQQKRTNLESLCRHNSIKEKSKNFQNRSQ